MSMFPSSCTDFEAITPYKIALAAIIKNYAEIADGKHDVNRRFYWVEDEPSSKCKFNRALLAWIHQPDGTLKSILQVLSTTSTTIHFSLCLTLQDLCNSESPQALDSFFEALSSLISDPPAENLLQRGGILGIFCRWMVLLYDKLEFSQLRLLQDNLIKYCSFLLEKKKTVRHHSLSDETSVVDGPEQEKSDSFDEMELESQSELDSKSSDESGIGVELKPSDLKTVKKSEELDMSDVFTSRQAKFFFKQQAMLIDEKESFAMSPVKLQNKIAQILKNNPKLTVAHYLSYLNCRRVKEFCGAIDCLLTFYNRLTVSGTSSDEAGKVCRHAALNLAILHHQFGHKSAAISAAHEAIDLSQASSDTQCLLQAISLLHELDPKHLNLTLLEHQVKPAKQMNLSALAVKAIHRDVSKLAWLGKPPCFVFKQLAASEALTRSKDVDNLSLASFIHKEALWKMYGKSEMAILFCQMTLSSHATGCKDHCVYPWQPNSEDVALALCHLVELFHEQGEIPMAQEVLQHLKQRFPREASHSKLWQITELRIRHKMALRNCKFSEATQVEQDMIALDKQEADFRKSERLYYTGDNLQAHDMLQRLLKNFENSNDSSRNSELNMRNPEYMCMIYIYLGRVLFSESSDSSASLTYLLLALSTATKHYLHKLVVKAKLLIAQLQLFSNRLVHAQQSLNSCTHEILTNGSLMEKSRYQLIQAKCKLARTKNLTVEDLNSLIALIGEAKQGFETVQDLHRQKDATYFLARLYNEKFKLLSGSSSISNILGDCIANRNKYSAEFRQISSLTFSSPCLLLT